MNLHSLIQSLIFGSAPKRGLKKVINGIFSSEFCCQTCATIAQRHTCGCSHTMKTTSNVIFISRKQLIAAVSAHVGAHTVMYCTVLYCTVLHCTVLYCTVLYCTVLYCTVLYCTVCLFVCFYLLIASAFTDNKGLIVPLVSCYCSH